MSRCFLKEDSELRMLFTFTGVIPIIVLIIFYEQQLFINAQVAVCLADEILTIAKYIHATTCDSCDMFDFKILI